MSKSYMQTGIGAALILSSLLAIAGVVEEAAHIEILTNYIHEKIGIYPDIVENITQNWDGIPSNNARLAARFVESASLFTAGIWTLTRR